VQNLIKIENMALKFYENYELCKKTNFKFHQTSNFILHPKESVKNGQTATKRQENNKGRKEQENKPYGHDASRSQW